MRWLFSQGIQRLLGLRIQVGQLCIKSLNQSLQATDLLLLLDNNLIQLVETALQMSDLDFALG